MIEFGRLKLFQQDGKLFFVPFAGDFVQRYVERLLPIIIQIDDGDRDLRIAAGLQDLEPLVSADKVVGTLVPD